MALPEAAGALARLIPDLPIDVLAAVALGARIATVKHGETVAARGERQKAGFVVSGLLWQAIRSADGRNAIVRYVGPGQPYGLISLYHPLPGTLLAAATSSIIRLRAEDLLPLSQRHPELSVFLAKAVADWGIEMAAAAEEFAFLTVAQRVVKHLLRLAGGESPTGERLLARVTQQELADAAGTAREVVARTLHELSAEGLISVSRGEITINDRRTLSRQVEIDNGTRTIKQGEAWTP